MLGVLDYAAFVLAIVVFLAIPGPGNLALLTSTAKGGVRGGLASTLGIMAGDQVLMWLAVAGVAKDSVLLLVIGLAVSIPLVVFGATMLMKLMK